MNILTVSDIETPVIYNDSIKKFFKDIDVAISCGDLSHYYLEYIISTLDIPLYFVHGNHTPTNELGSGEPRNQPWGAIDLHKRVIYDKDHNLIIAGIEGCLRYNKGKHQYTQVQMWKMVLNLVPSLLINKIKYHRYLDIFVSHAAPKGIHDQSDLAHQGIKAFTWLIKTFKPKYHLHGHIHSYFNNKKMVTKVGSTNIINTYGYRRITF